MGTFCHFVAIYQKKFKCYQKCCPMSQDYLWCTSNLPPFTPESWYFPDWDWTFRGLMSIKLKKIERRVNTWTINSNFGNLIHHVLSYCIKLNVANANNKTVKHIWMINSRGRVEAIISQLCILIITATLIKMQFLPFKFIKLSANKNSFLNQLFCFKTKTIEFMLS